jgi:hypothetical protein
MWIIQVSNMELSIFHFIFVVKIKPMFDFNQYLGFLAFLTILTIGFWLMIFLVSFIPYWIGGALIEHFKLKKQKSSQDE